MYFKLMTCFVSLNLNLKQKALEIAKLTRRIDELEDHNNTATTRIERIQSDVSF